MLDRPELEAIAEVAERHDLLVLSDEIYDRLVYGEHEHTAFSALPDMRERTVLLGGFSKSYAMTGWRIGYVAAPAELMSGIAKVHQYGIMCAPTPAQFAAIEALRSGEPHVQAMRAEYDRRRRYMTDRFNQIGLACFEPMGAFYCFPRVTDATGLDDDDLRRAAARRGARRRRARRSRSGRAARATSGSATPPRTRRSSRPWTASSASSIATGRDVQRSGAAAGFSARADDYAATMAPALAPMAAEVVRRAALQRRRSRARRRHRHRDGRGAGAGEGRTRHRPRRGGRACSRSPVATCRTSNSSRPTSPASRCRTAPWTW